MKLPEYVPQRLPDAKLNSCYIWFAENFIWNYDFDGIFYIKRCNGIWKAARIDRRIGHFNLAVPQYNNMSPEFPIEKLYQEYIFNKSIEESICQQNIQEV